MFLLTASRTLTLSVIFAYYKSYGIIFLGGYLVMMLISVLYYLMVQKNLDFLDAIRKMFPQEKDDTFGVIMGAIISLFAPCLLYDEFTQYYIIVATTSTISYILGFTIMVILLYIEQTPFEGKLHIYQHSCYRSQLHQT